jgi:hypothetical protein
LQHVAKNYVQQTWQGDFAPTLIDAHYIVASTPFHNLSPLDAKQSFGNLLRKAFVFWSCLEE